jgi:hypothetical protein
VTSPEIEEFKRLQERSREQMSRGASLKIRGSDKNPESKVENATLGKRRCTEPQNKERASKEENSGDSEGIDQSKTIKTQRTDELEAFMLNMKLPSDSSYVWGKSIYDNGRTLAESRKSSKDALKKPVVKFDADEPNDDGPREAEI